MHASYQLRLCQLVLCGKSAVPGGGRQGGHGVQMAHGETEAMWAHSAAAAVAAAAAVVAAEKVAVAVELFAVVAEPGAGTARVRGLSRVRPGPQSQGARWLAWPQSQRSATNSTEIGL